MAKALRHEPDLTDEQREEALKTQTPTLADTAEKRVELGRKLKSMIENGIEARSGLLETWQRVWRMMRNEPAGSNTVPVDDMAVVTTPLMPSRLDTFVAQLCGIVGRQNPINTVQTPIGDTDASTREEILHLAWVEAGFEEILVENAQHAALTDHGIWKLTHGIKATGSEEEGFGAVTAHFNGHIDYAGLLFETISPDDYVVAPLTKREEDATLLGNRFWESLATVEEKQLLGAYFPEDDNGAFIKDAPEGAPSPIPTATPDVLMGLQAEQYARTDETLFDGMPETQQVELFECWVKLQPAAGHLRRIYRAIVRIADGKLLLFEDWHWPIRPYATGSVIRDASTKSYWRKKSIGTLMLQMCDQMNRNDSLIFNGEHATAMPPIFGPELDDEKFTNWRPGEYIPLPEGQSSKIFQPAIAFKGEGLAAMNNKIERMADQVSRVSTNDTGAEESKSAITATQTNTIQAGAKVQLDHAIANFTMPFPKLVALSIMYLSVPHNWAYFAKRHGYTDEHYDLLTQPGMWAATGRSIAADPMQMELALQRLNQMAADPEYMISKPMLGQQALKYSGIPGAQRLQRQPDLNATPQPQTGQPGGQPGQPNLGNAAAPSPQPSLSGVDPGAPAPQLTQQGKPLPPLPATVVRPGANGPAAG